MSHCHAVIRSLREAIAGSERKAYSEEENHDQEMYAKPVLQWVVQLRGPIRTDTGTTSRLHTRLSGLPCLCISKRHFFCQNVQLLYESMVFPAFF